MWKNRLKNIAPYIGIIAALLLMGIITMDKYGERGHVFAFFALLAAVIPAWIATLATGALIVGAQAGKEPAQNSHARATCMRQAAPLAISGSVGAGVFFAILHFLEL